MIQLEVGFEDYFLMLELLGEDEDFVCNSIILEFLKMRQDLSLGCDLCTQALEYYTSPEHLESISRPIFEVLSLNLSDPIFTYVTVITSFTNIYSISFCFVFIYLVIYLIYNKMLSNNTNTLIPTLYQILAENLYKLSLNLFYSILGKHVSIPEFFIKINTIFIFLIISNIQGMIPYMSTLTSALTNTFFIALALFLSILTTLFDKKGVNYFLNLFMPSGCPILLSLLIIPIELISYSFRLVSLSVRLFANMMAGHTLLKVIVGFS
jgi:F-type H+-transporting ATPase subunit a